jgi:hypothetical protein
MNLLRSIPAAEGILVDRLDIRNQFKILWYPGPAADDTGISKDESTWIPASL